MAECLLEQPAGGAGEQTEVGLDPNGLTDQVSDANSRFQFNDGVFMTFGDGSNRYVTFPGLITAAGLRQYSYPGASSTTLANRSYTYPAFTSAGKLTPYQLPTAESGIVRSPVGTVFKKSFSTSFSGVAVQYTGNSADTAERCLFYAADANADCAVKDSGTALLTGGYYAFAAVLDDDKIYFHIPFAIGAGKTGKTDPHARLVFTKLASTPLRFRWRQQGSGTQRDQVDLTDEGTYDIDALDEYIDAFGGLVSGFEPLHVDSFGISCVYRLPAATGTWAVGEVVPLNLTNAIRLCWTTSAPWKLVPTASAGWTIVHKDAAASYARTVDDLFVTDKSFALTLAAASGKNLTSSSYAYAYRTTPIDLTDYHYLLIGPDESLAWERYEHPGEYETTSGSCDIAYTAADARIGFCLNPPVTSKSANNNFAAYLSLGAAGTDQLSHTVRKLDVSALTGNYYLTLYVKSRSVSGAYQGAMRIGNVMLN